MLQTYTMRNSLNKKFKGKAFKFETHHGGIVEGIVETIIIGNGLQLSTDKDSISDYVKYEIIVRSEKKNLYEFDRCWFK